NNIISQIQLTKSSNKSETIDNKSDYNKLIPSSKFWSDSEITSLIFYLADIFDLYCKNKTKFYSIAANKIGNNKTSTQ
ncbi:25774_t:CDS:1, partial [Gigaspora margarita]